MSTQPNPPIRRTTSKLWGVVRVFTLLTTVTCLTLLWTWQRAHAYGERVLSQLGEHMLSYAQAQHQSAPQELLINGSRFFISTGNIEAQVDEVLDHFHAKCNRRNGQLHDQWAEVAEARGVKVGGGYNSWLDGVFRGSSGRRGVVACLETGALRLSPELMLQRGRLALKTGDLSRLGDLRYVFVIPGSRKEVSVFVALWNEGSVNFRSMFPARGDAPGTDPEGVPRPANARRILAAEPKGMAKNQAASLHVYMAETRDPEELRAFYAAELPKAGFQIYNSQPALLLAGNGRRTLTLSLRNDPKSGKAVASLATISQ